MSQEFDFSRLLPGYAGVATTPKRFSPGFVIAAVDVFAVLVGVAALHVSGLLWSGSAVPPMSPVPSLISPVDAAEAAGVPDPHLRPLVAAVHLPTTPDAAVMFAAPMVTAAHFTGGSTFTSPASSSPPQVAASDPPAATNDPAPSPAAPPAAKLADIAVTGHIARQQATVAVAADTTLDDLLMSRGAGNAAGAGATDGTLALNADVGGTSAGIAIGAGAGSSPSVGVSANVQVASAAPVVHAVTSTVSGAVGGVTSAVRGLLN
jgi:hypothetical protein